MPKNFEHPFDYFKNCLFEQYQAYLDENSEEYDRLEKIILEVEKKL